MRRSLLLVAASAVALSLSLPAQQRYWMSPESVRPGFWTMFAPGAGWDTLRARIDVFSVHVNAFTVRDTAAMRVAAKALSGAGVRVNVECGGLRPFSGCDSLAGERQAQLELGQIARWTAVGGRVDFVTMDSPINTMIAGGDPAGTCGWTVERAANEMADYMCAVRQVLPGVTFALVEPVPWYSVGPYPAHPGNDYGDLLRTLDTTLTVLARRGEALAIFHSDCPYEYGENATTHGWLKLKAVEDWLHARGLRHGRIANSQQGGFTSDTLFFDRTLAAGRAFAAVGGNPDEIEVWCWYDHPAANAPEWQPYTFAWTCSKFFSQADTLPPRTPAKFEPPDGYVYHGVGQSGQGVQEYIAALSDSSIHPIVNKFYYDLPGSRGNHFTQLSALLDSEKAIGRIPELSIAFTDGNAPTDSTIAYGTTYDALIDSLARVCLDFGRRMFVRPAFEFNGPWNGYRPYLMPLAFRKVVDRFRAAGAADSVAFIWCYYPTGAPDDFDVEDGRGSRWYPGDSYVDWFGLDCFQSTDFDPALPDSVSRIITSKGKSERFLAMARAKGKPVFLSETSAAGVDLTSDPADGAADWDAWFKPFFQFIANHVEIKGWNYIDWDWTQYPQWAGWGDARIEVSPLVTLKYRVEMHNPKYIHLPYSGPPPPPPPVPDRVTLVAPPDSTAGPADAATLVWNVSAPLVDRYRVEVANDARFVTLFFSDSSSADTTAAVAPLLAGARYFWRVQAHNTVGWGPWSDVRQFTRTDTATVSPFARVSIDPLGTHQVMDGFGASSNFSEEAVARLPQSVQQQAFDLVFQDLGATILCIRLYADFQATEGGAYDWDVMATQRMILTEARARGSIDKIWVKVSSPPGWMKDNNDAAHGGHILPEHYDDYGNYLAYYVGQMKSVYGFDISAVSILNEPEYGSPSVDYESTSESPAQYHDIFAAVANAFESGGLRFVDLMGPEVGSVGQHQDYYTALIDDAFTASKLRRFTAHQYGDQLLLYGTGGGDAWPWLRDYAAAQRKNVWETEMYVGGPGMTSSDIDEGLRMALLMWNAVVNGDVSAWHYWHYLWPDESTQNKAQGLLALGRSDFTVNPRYYVFKQWSKNVRPGMTRVDATSDNPNLRVAAFTDFSKVVIVAFNRTNVDISTTFTSTKLGNLVSHVRTSAAESYAAQANIPASGGRFDVTIPAKSISTFTASLTPSAARPAPGVPALGLDVYPSPASGRATAVVRLPAGGGTTLEIFDVFGRRVAAPVRARVDGTASVPLSFDGLPAGTYVVRCTAASGSTSRRVAVVR